MTTICYRTNEPTYYNKGTKYETSCSDFLAFYSYLSVEEAQKVVDKINNEKPERLPYTNELAKCNERFYYVDEQPLFDTRGN